MVEINAPNLAHHYIAISIEYGKILQVTLYSSVWSNWLVIQNKFSVAKLPIADIHILTMNCKLQWLSSMPAHPHYEILNTISRLSTVWTHSSELNYHKTFPFIKDSSHTNITTLYSNSNLQSKVNLENRNSHNIITKLNRELWHGKHFPIMARLLSIPSIVVIFISLWNEWFV